MRRVLLFLLLLATLRGPAHAQPMAEETAYREVFAIAALGAPNPSLSLAASFGLAYRGLVGNTAFALARDAEGRAAWGYVGGAADPASAEAAALER
jgi:hypothetical protein